MTGVARRSLLTGMLGGAVGWGWMHPARAAALASIEQPPGTPALPGEAIAQAVEFLAHEISVDLHCHPGMFFLKGVDPASSGIPSMVQAAGFEAQTVSDMSVGGLTTGVFATVADAPLIGMRQTGLYARREFQPGEAYAEYTRQLGTLRAMADSGMVVPVLQPDDIEAARRHNRVGAIFATEGADFLETRGERIEVAYNAGIRVIGLVHYHVNSLGDIQTEPPVHGGLTPFGREAVQEMNALGIVADLAHATFATTRDAAEISDAPLMLSHSLLHRGTTTHPRLLSEDHARLIAQTGGIIGAWPSGLAGSDFPSFVDALLDLINLVGIDHVGLGTDMDANYKPVFTNYRQLPYLPAYLTLRGLGQADVARVLGGNFMRVFSAVAQRKRK